MVQEPSLATMRFSFFLEPTTDYNPPFEIPDIFTYTFGCFLEPFAPYLGYSDLLTCCLVCKQWQTVAQIMLFRHAFLAHSQQLASFLSAITQPLPPSLPINDHRRELAHAVRSIRYSTDTPTAVLVLRHCKNPVEFQEVWSPRVGPFPQSRGLSTCEQCSPPFALCTHRGHDSP